MAELKENFRNWLIEQGLSEKTSSGKQSTVYDYIKTIDRVCKNEGYITWEELASNLFSIASSYQSKYKTALHKYNSFLFDTEQSWEIMQQRHKNLLYAYSMLSDEKIKKREYITTKELADILNVDAYQIQRWRKNRIAQHKEEQIEENPRGQKQIGPKFVQVGGLYRYYKDDLEKYFHRPIEKM